MSDPFDPPPESQLEARMAAEADQRRRGLLTELELREREIRGKWEAEGFPDAARPGDSIDDSVVEPSEPSVDDLSEPELRARIMAIRDKGLRAIEQNDDVLPTVNDEWQASLRSLIQDRPLEFRLPAVQILAGLDRLRNSVEDEHKFAKACAGWAGGPWDLSARVEHQQSIDVPFERIELTLSELTSLVTRYQERFVTSKPFDSRFPPY